MFLSEAVDCWLVLCSCSISACVRLRCGDGDDAADDDDDDAFLLAYKWR